MIRTNSFSFSKIQEICFILPNRWHDIYYHFPAQLKTSQGDWYCSSYKWNKLLRRCSRDDAHNWQYECEFPGKPVLHTNKCTQRRTHNMRNGQRATLFSVNWRVQVTKLIRVPQDPTSSPVFCCSCLESFHKHKVFLEELILLDSALITHIACGQKMALQAIRWETIILF